jgi:lipopolysaccharide transport system permease protein
MMYATPVVYSSTSLPEKWQYYLQYNPMSAVIEGFRYGFLGTGSFNPQMLGYSLGITAVLFFISVILFNKVEKGFMDTV